MIVEKALGDAYGARFEMKPAAFVAKHNTGEDFPPVQPNARRLKVQDGALADDERYQNIHQYTDDTQMEIGTAELILSGKPFEQMTQLDLATAFFIAYKRDPHMGYARGFQGVLEQVQNPAELLHTLWPHSARNGAAMRASSWGYLPDAGQVIDMAMWQASLTHATQEGMLSAAAAALMVHAMRYRKCSQHELGEWLDRRLPLPQRFNKNETWGYPPHEGPVSMSGVETIQAALTAIEETGTMVDLLTRCVAFTGDVDTVAAIAMPVGAVCEDIEQNLPQALYDGLENGEYGLDYLRELDKRLDAAYPLPNFGKPPDPKKRVRTLNIETKIEEVRIDPADLSLTDDASKDEDELLDFDDLLGL